MTVKERAELTVERRRIAEQAAKMELINAEYARYKQRLLEEQERFDKQQKLLEEQQKSFEEHQKRRLEQEALEEQRHVIATMLILVVIFIVGLSAGLFTWLLK